MYIGRPQKTGPYIKLDDISNQFNGIDVSFGLTSGGTPFYADNPYTITVSLNGVVQEPVSAYTIVEDQITFASPPLATSDFFAVVIGTTVNREVRNATSLATGIDITVGSLSADNLNFSGVITATSFEGDGSQLTGIDATALKDSNGTVRVQANESGAVVSGILTTTSLDVSGSVVSGALTATSLDVSGNVSIAGTLTYEDVTSIDSVGLITARSGIHVGTGITYTEDLVVDGGARITGILTIGTDTITIDGDNNSINIGAGVTLSTTTSSFNQLEVVGVTTLASAGGITTTGGDLYVGNNLSVDGTVTASDYNKADGSPISGSIGIQSAGTVIGTGFTSLNFIGAGNTFLDRGNGNIDISISGSTGGGGGGSGGLGTAIAYEDGELSPFSYIDKFRRVTSNLNMTNVNAGASESYIVSVSPNIIVNAGIGVTVGAGKTMIIDVLKIGDL